MRAEGIYENVDINEYHSEEGISNSGISLLLDCPKRYYYEYHEKQKTEDTDSQKIGRAVHMLILEPENFEKHFLAMNEDIDLRTKDGKEKYSQAQINAQGRTILRYNEYENIRKISEVARQHEIWKDLQGGKVEHSVYWNERISGARLRTRPDIYTRSYIIDVKTTDSIPAFQKSIYQYGYHRQAAMQIDGLKKFDKDMTKERHFGFFVIEKKEPYLTACFTLDAKSIELGRQEYMDAAQIYTECKMTNSWPGYDSNFQMATIPSYLVKKEELI